MKATQENKFSAIIKDLENCETPDQMLVIQKENMLRFEQIEKGIASIAALPSA